MTRLIFGHCRLPGLLSLFAASIFISSTSAQEAATIRELLETIDQQRQTIESLETRIRKLENKQVVAEFDINTLKGVVTPEIFANLKKVQREIERLEKNGDAKGAAEFRKALVDFAKQAQGQLSNNVVEPELHHIGVYEGMLPGNKKRGFRKHPEGLVEVTVDYTGGPIMLALSSYEPVLWKLRIADGVEIRRVILAGSKQRIEGLPDNVKVQRKHKGRNLGYLGYARNDGETPYGRTISLLKEVTGVTPSSFLGSYRYDGRPMVIGVANSDWSRQVLEHRLERMLSRALEFERNQKRERYQVVRFHGPYSGEQSADRRDRFEEPPVSWAEFTPTGPIASSLAQGSGRHISRDPKGPTFFGIRGHSVFRLATKVDADLELKVPANLPELSWPCGLTFDTKRRRLILISLGGEGHMYAYDVAKQEWSLLTDMGNRDLASICYSNSEDVFYGFMRDHNGKSQLLTYAPNGGLLATINVDIPVSSQDRHGPGGSGTVYAAGGYAAVIVPQLLQLPSGTAIQCGKCYLINPVDGAIVFSDWSRPHAGQTALRPADLESLWKALANIDELELTIWRMASGGDKAVQFIHEKLSELESPDVKDVNQWIQQLSSANFAVRKQAFDHLAALGGAADDVLKKHATDSDSVEQRLSLQQLLSASEKGFSESPTARQHFNALKVLSRMDRPSAQKALHELAVHALNAAHRKKAAELLKTK